MIEQLHWWAALAAAVAAVLVAAAAVAAVLVAAAAAAGLRSGRMPRLLVDRAILVALAALAVAGVVGLVQLAAGTRPGDPLHFVYAAAAILILPIARFWGRGAWERRRPLVVALAGVILVGLVVRLAQTG